MCGIAFAEQKLLTVDEPYPTHLEVKEEGMNSAFPLSGMSSIAIPLIELGMKLPAYPLLGQQASSSQRLSSEQGQK